MRVFVDRGYYAFRLEDKESPKDWSELVARLGLLAVSDNVDRNLYSDGGILTFAPLLSKLEGKDMFPTTTGIGKPLFSPAITAMPKFKRLATVVGTAEFQSENKADLLEKNSLTYSPYLGTFIPRTSVLSQCSYTGDGDYIFNYLPQCYAIWDKATGTRLVSYEGNIDLKDKKLYLNKQKAKMVVI